MDVVHTTNKGIHMNSMEKFFIWRETELDKEINGKNTAMQNTLIDIILQKDDKLDGALRSQQEPTEQTSVRSCHSQSKHRY
jgi:hypothetical protein